MTKKEKTFEEMMGDVSDAQIAATSKDIATNFGTRMAFENSMRPGNDSIQKKLTACKAKLVAANATKVIVAASVDADFINRTLTDGRRYNIYAAQKLADLIGGLESGTVANAVNKSVAASFFRVLANGLTFTSDTAKAAVSDKIKVDPKLSKVMVRHSASPVTAATQASSTMNALVTLGIARNIGTAKHPSWVATDAPATKRMKAVLGV